VNIIHRHLHQHVPLTRSTNGWSLGNFFWSAKEYAPLALISNPCILSCMYVLHTILMINTSYFPKQYKPADLRKQH
jgi:hypothetical protein